MSYPDIIKKYLVIYSTFKASVKVNLSDTFVAVSHQWTAALQVAGSIPHETNILWPTDSRSGSGYLYMLIVSL